MKKIFGIVAGVLLLISPAHAGEITPESIASWATGHFKSGMTVRSTMVVCNSKEQTHRLAGYFGNTSASARSYAYGLVSNGPVSKRDVEFGNGVDTSVTLGDTLGITAKKLGWCREGYFTVILKALHYVGASKDEVGRNILGFSGVIISSEFPALVGAGEVRHFLYLYKPPNRLDGTL